MKIVILSNSTWNIYNFRKDLLKFFLEKGDEIYVIAPDNYNLKQKIKRINLINIRLNNTNIYYDIIYIIRLFFIFKSIKPDIILSFNIKPNIFSGIINFFFNYKIIANVTGLGSSIIKKSSKRKIIFFLYKLSFKNITHIFFQNPDDRKIFRKLGITNIENTSIVPGSGINLNNYNYNSNKFYSNKFIYIGRFLKDKGIIELMEAIKIILLNNKNKIKFVFVGKFDEDNPSSINKNDFIKFVNNYNIEYIPFSENIIDIYNQSDALILPSYREGTPRVILEAMALGVNVLTSNAVGCKHIIDDNKNGLIFLKKNKQDIIKTINKFISLDNIVKIDMIKNARQTVENKFDIKILIDIYDKKINEILND